jgi:hypothetical protein
MNQKLIYQAIWAALLLLIDIAKKRSPTTLLVQSARNIAQQAADEAKKIVN